jgi:hypothetical protein
VPLTSNYNAKEIDDRHTLDNEFVSRTKRGIEAGHGDKLSKPDGLENS